MPGRNEQDLVFGRKTICRGENALESDHLLEIASLEGGVFRGKVLASMKKVERNVEVSTESFSNKELILYLIAYFLEFIKVYLSL